MPLSSIQTLFTNILEKEGTTTLYKENSFIYREGDVSKKILRVNFGAVFKSKKINSKKTLPLNILYNQEIFPLTMFSKDKTKYHCTAETIVDSKIDEITFSSFREGVIEHPNLSLEIVDIISNELQNRDESLKRYVVKPIKDRVYNMLCQLEPLGKKESWATRIDFISRQQLSHLVGIDEATLSRCLSKLEKEKLISKTRNEIILH